MKIILKCAIAIMIAAFGSGCAASGKKAPAVDPVKQQSQRVDELTKRLNNNTAAINENKSNFDKVNQKLTDLEQQLNTTLTDQKASLQEIQENIAFINDLAKDNASSSLIRSAVCSAIIFFAFSLLIL